MASAYRDNGLPKNQGFYLKRGVIYVTIYHPALPGGKKSYCTGTDKVAEAREWKHNKIASLKVERDITVKRGVRMAELFGDYLDHLKAKEADAGVYMSVPTSTPSYKTRKQIEKHLLPFFRRPSSPCLNHPFLRS